LQAGLITPMPPSQRSAYHHEAAFLAFDSVPRNAVAGARNYRTPVPSSTQQHPYRRHPMPTTTVVPLPTPPQAMSTDDLETELLSLAGHIAAAQARCLQLLAEFDDRGGWAGDGIRSCAHGLSWRAGTSL